jgi:NitT/TauT family transport system ATP-binding protein
MAQFETGKRTQDAATLLEVRGISKSFGIGPLRQLVLEDCSFTLETGRLTVLIGPSGCGKSTLVNILAGYEGCMPAKYVSRGTWSAVPGSIVLWCFRRPRCFPG